MLLGSLQMDGSRRPGAIDKFRLDTQNIVAVVAEDTETKGNFEDAVKLYDLAQVCSHVCWHLIIFLFKTFIKLSNFGIFIPKFSHFGDFKCCDKWEIHSGFLCIILSLRDDLSCIAWWHKNVLTCSSLFDIQLLLWFKTFRDLYYSFGNCISTWRIAPKC